MHLAIQFKLRKGCLKFALNLEFFSHFEMLNLNAAQRSFIRGLYKKTKGCYLTIAREYTLKFKKVCPSMKTVRAISAEEEEVDERIIRDVFLPQFSPPDSSSNSLTFALFLNHKARAQSRQNLRNAAKLRSRDLHRGLVEHESGSLNRRGYCLENLQSQINEDAKMQTERA